MKVFKILQGYLVIRSPIMCNCESSLWFNHSFYKISKYLRAFINKKRLQCLLNSTNNLNEGCPFAISIH